MCLWRPLATGYSLSMVRLAGRVRRDENLDTDAFSRGCGGTWKLDRVRFFQSGDVFLTLLISTTSNEHFAVEACPTMGDCPGRGAQLRINLITNVTLRVTGDR